MTVLVRRAVWAYSEEFGFWGWRPGWNAWGDPGSAMTLAHDVLEHRLRDTDSVAHELRAFGAVAAVRGEGGYWADKNYPHIAQNTANELARLVAKQRDSGEVLADPPGCRAATAGDAMLEEMIAHAENDFEDVGLDEALSASERSAIRAWLREGYRGVRARYGVRFGFSGIELAELFRNLERVIDKAGGNGFMARDGEEYANHTLHLRLDLQARTITCCVKTPWGEEY